MPDINDLLKPVPVAFDYATFRYYLELDILQDTAKFLDWVDINLYLGGTTRTTTVTGTILATTNTVVFDEPLPFTVPDGTAFGLAAPVDYTYEVTNNIPFGRPNTELWVNVYPYFEEDIAVTVAGNAGTLKKGTNIIIMAAGVPATIPVGTQFTFTHAKDLYLVGSIPIGTTEGTVNEAAGDDDLPVSYTLVEENLPYRSVQNIYDAITDEVVLRMGYTHPLQVPEAKIREMMLLGRIEAWRAVARNTVTDIDFQSGGLLLIRSQFHQNALRQWALAAEDYNKEFGYLQDITYTTPDVRTYSGSVKGRW